MSWSEVFETVEPDALTDLALLARQIASTPLAFVTLVDGERQWYTSLIGATSLPDVPWNKSFCFYAVQDTSVFVVPDAPRDPRFVDHPLVCATPSVCFYAGAPLMVDDHVIGTLCVMDVKPRTLPSEVDAGLQALARQAVTQLQWRRQARELAALNAEIERLDGERRELMLNVSHDLRTPLTAARAYLDTVLLKDPHLDASSRCHIEQALRLSDGAARLVADLFELAHLDGGGIVLEYEAFSLAELTRDVMQSFAVLARSKDITLQLAVEPDDSTVHADLRLIERVLWNLVDNALRFTPPRGVITATCESNGTHVAVRIGDTGPGVPAADYERVFDRFYRSGDAASHSTGLGLSIARRIVELHGGVLGVDSAPGGGAEFRCTLKRRPVIEM